jgi:hypothetical protein
MKVRIINHPEIPIGTILDVSDEEAAGWVRRGRGEYVKDIPVETAAVAPPENTALRTSKPTPRKR